MDNVQNTNQEQLSLEQLNVAKGFSDTLKKEYGHLRSGGFSQQEAFSIVAKIPTKPQPVVKAPLFQRAAEGITDVVGGKELAQGAGQVLAGSSINKLSDETRQQSQGVANQLIERLKLAREEGDVNKINKWTELLEGLDYGEDISKGYTDDLVTNKQVIGSAIKLAGTAAGGYVGSKLIGGGRLLTGLATEGAIQGGSYGLGEGISQNESIPEIALDTIKNALFGSAGGVALGKGFQVAGKALAGRTARIAEEAIAKKSSKLSDYMKFDSPTKGVIEIPTTPKNQAIFTTATKRGFEPKDARFFSDIGNEDKVIMSKMQNLSEKLDAGELPASFTERPIDYIGTKVQKTIGEVNGKLNTFGEELEKVAQNLKGKSIDNKAIITKLETTLNKFGVAAKKDAKGVTYGFDFSNSDFALLENKELKKALDYAYSTKADAYDVHRVKRTLDTLIKGGKTGEGLQGQSKILIQQLRKDVDGFLDSRFKDYKTVNDKLTDTFKMREAVESLFGKKMSTESIGQKFRGIFSNNVSRGATKDFIETLSEYTKKYGIKTEGDIVNLTYFAEKLEDLYGTQAITGLRGNVERAIKGVMKTAEIVRNPIKGVLNVAGDVVEQLAGQTDKAKKAFIKSLLSNSDEVAKTTALKNLNSKKKELVTELKANKK